MENSIFLVLVFSCGLGLAAQDTGFPAGLMAECPGMNRSTFFSEETKRSLYVVAVRPNPGFFGTSERKCALSVAGANCAAKYLDFRKRKTQVIISGYLDASFSPLVRLITRVYTELGRNVIIVEIFPLLIRPYPIAARITQPLGALLGEFLAELSRQGLPATRLELVGGSLGAHVASFASVKYRQLTGRRPARLTGLDPAGPCFRNLPPAQRFNADAAVRVDAIHTNIDGFGIADAIAQVDFYPNGGESQQAMIGNFLMPCFLLCSHVRSAYYWVLAITNPDKFLAVQCDSVASARHGNCYEDPVQTNYLGTKTNFSQPGIYFLPTTESPPYYLGVDGLKQRKYGVNNYLLKTTSDDDITI